MCSHSEDIWAWRQVFSKLPKITKSFAKLLEGFFSVFAKNQEPDLAR
jgi:hypothetical protein